MTAEIAILNKSGIALAADSAVSIIASGNTKIYNTNKLFMLSKYQPLGVMIYGNSEFMGIPWETIIKAYRRQLGDGHFKSLHEYGVNFVAFLHGNIFLFPPNEQEAHVYGTTLSVFRRIKTDIDKKVEEATHKGLTPSRSDIDKIVREEIKSALDFVKTRPLLSSLPANFATAVLSKYFKIIEQAIDDVFAKLTPVTAQRKQLRRISVALFANDFFGVRDGTGRELLPSSGVVIAGFGDDDLYPAIISYEMEGVVDGVTKYKEDFKHNITSRHTAALFPFAQKEMVLSFMEGVSPTYKKALSVYLVELFDNYPAEVVKRLPHLSPTEKNELIEELKKDGSSLISTFADKINAWVKQYNSDKVLDSIEVLPIAELASMAESLVNLTSFKRRVTLEVAETVGGPIDVAVISKGDGFIWIRRKHYFEGADNPHFLQSFYR
jgi:hypothetical protein